MLPQPPLLLISDRRQVQRPLAEVIASAFAAGCRWVSLREKDLAPKERLALLRELVALARPYGAAVSVHEDADAAAAAGAGLHLPAKGSLAAARQRLGAQTLIGISCHTPTEVAAAARAGADYVTLSPIFASPSKPGYGPPLGCAALAAAARETSVPILALGGVTPGNAPSVLAAGAAGIAVMGGIMAAEDAAAAAAFLAALRPS